MNDAILKDIQSQSDAIQKQMDEQISRMESTPVGERTVEWRTENQARMEEYLKKVAALGERWSQLNSAVDNSGPTQPH
jgi:uncharacterized protein (DUF885 family)